MQAPCFHTALKLKKVGPREWELLEDLIFESVLLKGFLMMPQGARTNLASTPWFLWWLIPPSGQYDYSTALHDGGYRGTLCTLDGQRIRLVRPLCDLLLDEGNEATNVNPKIRKIMLRGVQWFGGGSYVGVHNE